MSTPTIKSLPILGNALDISKGIIPFFSEHFKSSNSFIFKLPMRKIFTTCDADVIQHILISNHKNYRKDYDSNKLKMTLGNGLLTNDGESWFKQRRLAQPAFYKNRLEGFFDVMNTMTKNELQDWKTNNKQSVFIDAEMMQLTSKIVVETLLGADVAGQLNPIQKHIYDLQLYMMNCMRNPMYKTWSKLNGKRNQFENAVASLDKILYHVINERKKQTAKNDLLSMLMDARDIDTNEGMSDTQLRDELLTIYVAGHETSGYAISWAMYNLCKHPEKYKKAKEEVQSIMKDGELSIENYKQLTYIKAVIDETLRLYPTAYVLSRESKEAAIVNDTAIPKETVLFLSLYHLHRHKAYWQQADDFIPERFIGKQNPLLNANAYYPFGAGPRMCIGFNFATMEITIVLAQLLYHFDFEIDTNHEVILEPLVTLKPKNGIKLNIKQ
jgi:cytochrome P450